MDHWLLTLPCNNSTLGRIIIACVRGDQLHWPENASQSAREVDGSPRDVETLSGPILRGCSFKRPTSREQNEMVVY